MTAQTLDVAADPNVEPARYSRAWFRFFEILPGASVWLAILSPFILSFYAPLTVTIFVILFDTYWLIRALVYAATLINGYFKLRRNVQKDWGKELEKLSSLSDEERHELKVIDWQNIYHAVIMPTYKEELVTLEKSLDSIVHSHYPLERMLVVLATEGRDAENARAIGKSLSKRYEKTFLRFMVTEHPDGIVGEVKAKGANAAWAARILVEEVGKMGIPLENIIVSAADADTRFPTFYFQCLAYNYCVTPDRKHASFQPIATFFNNIWQASMLSRTLAFSTTFWQLGESIRSYRLITFSTHATSLATLRDMGYWCTSVVNEDSRQFFRAFFHYHGNFRVIPIFIPIYMDAVHLQKPVETLRNLYYQQQRWAYGVEHFPYIVLESWRQRKQIPLNKRVAMVSRAFEGSFSWATSSFFLSVVGWLPMTLNTQFRDQVVASNFPQVAQSLLSLAWVGLIVASAVTLLILPPRPEGKSFWHWLTMIIQWILVPITSVLFGAIPGIDAQTRLMLGKYIGFRVTEKKAV